MLLILETVALRRQLKVNNAREVTCSGQKSGCHHCVADNSSTLIVLCPTSSVAALVLMVGHLLRGMFKQGLRRFATSALRAAETTTQIEARNHYGIQVSKAQGHVNGLVGGKPELLECLLVATSATHPQLTAVGNHTNYLQQSATPHSSD